MLTYQDAVERLVDYVGGTGSDQLVRDAKHAAQEALRDVISEHPWTYLYTHGRVVTTPAYTDGLITYQASSGAYPYLVTLTGGVWPAWAAEGALRLNNINFEVAWRVSDAELALKSVPAPPAEDITEPSAYGLYQYAYDLPPDFGSQDVTFVPNNFGGLAYVHPREWLVDTAAWGVIGTPWMYTVMAPPHDPSRLQLRLAPYPAEERPIEFIYKRRARQLLLYSYGPGKASGAMGSRKVTLAGTNMVWTPDVAQDTVLRLSTTAQVPTPPWGNNPAAFESRAVALPDTATLIVADPLPWDFTQVAYVISSRVDIDPEVMEAAYHRCCERHIGMSRVLKDKPSAAGQYREALELAKCADARATYPRVASSPRPYYRRLRDYPINVVPEV